MINEKKGKSLKDLEKLMGPNSSKSLYNKGKIKKYFTDKKYGFIRQDNGEDLFFHMSDVQSGIPTEGAQVEYLIGEGRKGPAAKKIFIQQRGQEGTSRYKDEATEKQYLPKDTEDVIELVKCENYSLALNRLVEWRLKNKTSAGTEISEVFLSNMTESSSLRIISNYQITRFKNLKKHLENTHNICAFSAKVSWRLIVGLGAENIHETSMTLHHIYGIPYIPGSALKGISRDAAIADLCSDAENEDPDVMDALISMPDLFETDQGKKRKKIRNLDKIKWQNGDINKPEDNTIDKILRKWDKFEAARGVFGSQKKAGKVVFFDAFPEEDLQIALDIMNPHYPKYYSENQAPSDWQNPVPIHFLTVEKTIFNFVLALNKKVKERLLLETAASWLKRGIQEHGVGAKTSVGYGYFV